MTPREITTLIHRLFYGDISHDDGWVHLMLNSELCEERVVSFIDKYFDSSELLLFVNSQHCMSSSKMEAFGNIKHLLFLGIVRIADPRFQTRALINPIVVGVGSTR